MGITILRGRRLSWLFFSIVIAISIASFVAYSEPNQSWVFISQTDDTGQVTRLARIDASGGPGSFWIADREGVLPAFRNQIVLILDLEAILHISFPDVKTVDKNMWYGPYTDEERKALVYSSLDPVLADLRRRNSRIPWDAIFEPEFRTILHDWNESIYVPLRVTINGDPFPESNYSTSHPSGWAIFNKEPPDQQQEVRLQRLTGYKRPFCLPLAGYGGRLFKKAETMSITYLDGEAREREMSFSTLQRWFPPVPLSPLTPEDRKRWHKVHALPFSGFSSLREEAWLHPAAEGLSQLRFSLTPPMVPDHHWPPYDFELASWTLETESVPISSPVAEKEQLQSAPGFGSSLKIPVSFRVMLKDNITPSVVEKECLLAWPEPFCPENGRSNFFIGLFGIKRSMILIEPGVRNAHGLWTLLGQPIEGIERIEASIITRDGDRTIVFESISSLSAELAHRPSPPQLPDKSKWRQHFLFDLFDGIRLDYSLPGFSPDAPPDLAGLTLHLIGPSVCVEQEERYTGLILSSEEFLERGIFVTVQPGEEVPLLSEVTELSAAPLGEPYEFFVPVRVRYTANGHETDSGWYYSASRWADRGGWFAPEDPELRIESPLSGLNPADLSALGPITVSLFLPGPDLKEVNYSFPATSGVNILFRQVETYARELYRYFNLR